MGQKQYRYRSEPELLDIRCKEVAEIQEYVRTIGDRYQWINLMNDSVLQSRSFEIPVTSKPKVKGKRLERRIRGFALRLMVGNISMGLLVCAGRSW